MHVYSPHILAALVTLNSKPFSGLPERGACCIHSQATALPLPVSCCWLHGRTLHVLDHGCKQHSAVKHMLPYSLEKQLRPPSAQGHDLNCTAM